MKEKGKLAYQFFYQDTCNMCQAPVSESKVLGMRLNTSQGLKPRAAIGLGVTVMKCGSCGLIYSDPQPIPFNIEDHYNVDPSEYWDEQYFSGDEHKMTHHEGVLKDLMDIKPGMKALDIGTGVGLSMLELERIGFDTYGIEPSEQFVKYAIEKNGISPDKIKLGMMEEVELEDGQFDFILLRVVLEHVYDPAACVEQAMKWLKPNGILHIEVPSSNHLIAKLINFYFRLAGTNYVTNLSPAHTPYHLYEFSAEAFKKHGQRANYEVLSHEYYPADVFFFPKVLHPILTKLMRMTDTGMQLAIWLKKK